VARKTSERMKIKGKPGPRQERAKRKVVAGTRQHVRTERVGHASKGKEAGGAQRVQKKKGSSPLDQRVPQGKGRKRGKNTRMAGGSATRARTRSRLLLCVATGEEGAEEGTRKTTTAIELFDSARGERSKKKRLSWGGHAEGGQYLPWRR